MRITFEKALDVVNRSRANVAIDVQKCINLLEKYATNANVKTPMIDYLHNVVINEAEIVLADHYVAYMAQVEAEKQNAAMI